MAYSANIEGLNYIGIEKRNGIQTAKFKAVAGSFTMKMNNGRLVATTGKGF
jgi:hypothetical protein